VQTRWRPGERQPGARTDVEERIKNALPARAGFLANPITGAVHTATYQITLKLVQSQQFQHCGSWPCASRTRRSTICCWHKWVPCSHQRAVTWTSPRWRTREEAAQRSRTVGVRQGAELLRHTVRALPLRQLAKLQRWVRFLNRLALVLRSCRSSCSREPSCWPRTDGALVHAAADWPCRWPSCSSPRTSDEPVPGVAQPRQSKPPPPPSSTRRRLAPRLRADGARPGRDRRVGGLHRRPRPGPSLVSNRTTPSWLTSVRSTTWWPPPPGLPWSRALAWSCWSCGTSRRSRCLIVVLVTLFS